MKKKFLFVCLSIFFYIHLKAQNDCNNYLDQSKSLYQIGKFDQVVSTIKTCSSAEADPVKQWQSSRLLAQAYLGLYDSKNAKSAAEDMLEKNPLYKPSLIEDSKEFVTLLHSVTVVPRFSLSLSVAAGININYPNVVHSYGVTDNKKNYENGQAKQFGLYSGYSFSKRLSAHIGVIYAESNYSLTYTVQNLNFTYDETLNFLQVPLFARFQIKPKGTFKVFAQTGGIAGFLSKAIYDMEKIASPTETTNLKSIDITDSRTKLIYGAIMGIGASYKLKEGHIFGEINYQNSFTNINKENTRYSNANLINNYFYIDDDLRLNNLTFSLGYTFYLNYFVQRSK